MGGLKFGKGMLAMLCGVRTAGCGKAGAADTINTAVTRSARAIMED